MIPTLRSGRLARLKVERLNYVQITELLDSVLAQEMREDFPRKGIRQIAKLADGCPRDALSLLDTVIDMDDEEEILNAILDSKVHEGDVRELCRILLETRTNRWTEIFNILETLTEEAEEIRYGILEYFRKVLGNNPNPRLGWMMNRFSETMIYSKRPGLYLACWEVVWRDTQG
jgi:DNA polymerase III gamma/tau subunit